MERLTRKTTPTGRVLLPIIPPMPPVMGAEICGDHRDKVRLYQDYAIRLSAYEDTNLTPTDIAALQAENKRLRETNSMLENDLANANMNLEHIEAELTDLRGQIERGEIVRVVKCPECEYFRKDETDDDGSGYCHLYANDPSYLDVFHVSADHYCSTGEHSAALK